MFHQLMSLIGAGMILGAYVALEVGWAVVSIPSLLRAKRWVRGRPG